VDANLNDQFELTWMIQAMTVKVVVVVVVVASAFL
jgi:hypothetical protein